YRAVPKLERLGTYDWYETHGSPGSFRTSDHPAGSWPLTYAILLSTMHDLNYFRDHPELFADMAKRRNMALDLDAFRALDKERRELITENEKRKAQRNKASEEIGRLKKEKKNADSLLGEMKHLSEVIKQTDERIEAFDARQREVLLTIPNIPHSSVP